MKICPSCGHSVGDLLENCPRCGEALEVTPEAIVADMKRRANRPIFPLLLLLLPAALLGAYSLLVWLEMLPVKIEVLGRMIRLDQMFTTDSTTVIGAICFFVLPIICGLAVLARLVSRSNAEKAAEGLEGEARIDGSSNEAVGQGAGAPVSHSGDGAAAAAANGIAEQEEWFEPGSAEAKVRFEFSYRKLRAIDTVGTVSDIYTDNVSLGQLNEKLQSFVAMRGVSISDECLRSLLSAMAASRLLWVTGKDAELIRRALAAVSEFFGSEVHIDAIGGGISSPEELAVRHPADGEKAESSFIVDVYSSLYAPKAVRFAALEGVDPETLGSYFSEYLDSAQAGERERQATVLRVSDVNSAKHILGGRMKLPNNVWYVLIPNARANDFARPEDAIPVDLSALTAMSAEAELPVVEREPVSLERFCELARKARDVHFIPEEYWKKVDILEEYIAKRVSGYRLDNKSIRKIEAFVAVHLSADGKLYDALDRVVSAKILPKLYGCPHEEISGDEQGLAQLLDRVFGLDNMPMSLECARRLGAV